MINGPDLSHHNDDNGPIDFDLMRGHVDFVISKITQGTGYVDPKGAWHVSETRRIGAIPGLYHFPEWGNAVAEAQWFAQHAGDITGAFFAFDCEAIPKGVDPVAFTLAFLSTSRDLLGVKGLTYMNKSVLRGYDWSPVIRGDFGLWEANYDGDATDFSLTGAWPAVALKQYTDSGSLDGVTGGVDLDSFNGSREQLLAYCKPAGPAPLPTPPAPVPAPPSPWLSLPTLTYGTKGSAAVKRLQQFMLNTFPAYQSQHPGMVAEGNYLTVTQQWVLEFQKRTGIRNADGSAPDGKTVGRNTNAKLWAFGYRG